MPKKKESKDVEFYLGTIRNLRSEIRHLQKEVKRLKKQEHLFEEKDSYEDEVEEVQKSKNICQHCFKGYMEEMIIINRIFSKCNVCGERTKAIIIK